jgi:sigma-54-specific transcriptional regulator
LAPVLERLFDAGCPGLFGAIEAFIVKQALKRCNGNQVHSAKLLGLTRHVLRRHLRRHGLLAKHATAARVAVAPAAKRYPLQVADREIL